MRFEVPQFIEIEDKIFGPFTVKQFIYLSGGVGFAVVLYLTTSFFVFIILGFPIGIISLLLAFYRQNNRPFATLLESFFNYTLHSHLYLWKRSESIVYKGRQTTDIPETTIKTSIPKNGKNNLASLSRKLEMKALQKEK